MRNAVLLGDSIFDNASYARAGEAVIDELGRGLSSGEATLLAQDGAVIAGVSSQLQRMPNTATHLFISAGGNDALRASGVLTERASTVADALAKIEAVRDAFARSYGTMLDAAAQRGLPTTVCTIYDSQLPEPTHRRLSNLALGVLNDAITRHAVSRRLPVIDLRVLFSEPADYANAVEPSGQGSRKIARMISEVLERHDFTGPTVVYAA